MGKEECMEVMFLKRTQLKPLCHSFVIKMWLEKNKPKFRVEVRRSLLTFRRTHRVIQTATHSLRKTHVLQLQVNKPYSAACQRLFIYSMVVIKPTYAVYWEITPNSVHSTPSILRSLLGIIKDYQLITRRS